MHPDRGRDEPTYNPSSIDPSDPNTPLSLLPSSSVCAAWTVDSTSQSGLHAGQFAWPMCGTDRWRRRRGPGPVRRDPYPRVDRHHVLLHALGLAAIRDHQPLRDAGRVRQDAGLAFRGVLYAPYDDVKITGGNGFNTVGQVLAWTAKFNGGSAYIDLDYPYDFTPASPYLLEPGIGQ